MTKQEMPIFASEAEEAAWWYENRENHESHFEQALLEGRVWREALPNAWLQCEEKLSLVFHQKMPRLLLSLL